jgi:L-lactate utilization protein LutB
MRWQELVKQLKKNGFEAVVAADAAQARAKVLELIPEQSEVGVGGSETIRQLGLIEALRERGCLVFDHWRPGLSRDEVKAIKDRHGASPFFLTSTNALTRDGRLINTDNTGNRVAAMIYGPRQVIVVAGRNKVVENVDQGLERVKWVAPRNAKRRNDPTPCAKTGQCEDCHAPARLCRVTTILDRKTRGVGRFTVILVDEDLGI